MPEAISNAFRLCHATVFARRPPQADNEAISYHFVFASVSEAISERESTPAEQQRADDAALLVSKGKLFENCDIKFSEWLPEVYRVMKSGTHIYFMVNGRNYKDLQIEAEKAGFIYQNTLVWVKQNATSNRYYMAEMSRHRLCEEPATKQSTVSAPASAQKCEFILMLKKTRHET